MHFIKDLKNIIVKYSMKKELTIVAFTAENMCFVSLKSLETIEKIDTNIKNYVLSSQLYECENLGLRGGVRCTFNDDGTQMIVTSVRDKTVHFDITYNNNTKQDITIQSQFYDSLPHGICAFILNFIIFLFCDFA